MLNCVTHCPSAIQSISNGATRCMNKSRPNNGRVVMTTEQASNKALLVLPRLRVQNANAISSPMTWGFPAITAFTGLMTALERRLEPEAGVAFYGVGVI